MESDQGPNREALYGARGTLLFSISKDTWDVKYCPWCDVCLIYRMDHRAVVPFPILILFLFASNYILWLAIKASGDD